MNSESNKFESFVVDSILANNPFGITQVLNLVSLRSTYFDNKQYDLIEALIIKGDIVEIKKLSANLKKNSEFLEVMLFQDQFGNSYVVTVYDSDQLWQDPQVIKIYSIKS